MVAPCLRHHLTGAPLLPERQLSRRDVIRYGSGALFLLAHPAMACRPADVSVSLFTEISQIDVPAAAMVIRTQGWQKPGVGAARYIFDAAIDPAWVARYPRSSAISANGRGFRLETVGGDVRQYGAIGDGKADDTAAINEALARGGAVRLAGPGIYQVTDRLLITVPNTRLLFDKAVTLRTRAWRYRGNQNPFGNAIHVTADDCEILGGGPTSVLENVGSDANGIGFLHCGGGKVAGMTLKGGKQNVRAIVDDTFQSGISIVNDVVNSPAKRPSRTIVEDCVIVDWVHYAVNIYGDLASDIIIRRTAMNRIGTINDHASVGAGIAMTRGVGPILVDGNTISENKGYGVFVSSAGAEVHDITVSNNRIIGNGLDGIRASEERNFGGADAVGLRRITISRNRIEKNGAMGIRVGTYDGIGSIRHVTITHNRIFGNHGSGILLQANDMPGRDVEAVITSNELVANDEYGIAVGLNRVSIRHSENRFDRNRTAPTIDYRGGSPRPLIGR